MQKVININLDELKRLINKHSVDIKVCGHTPFIHKAIKVPGFFDEIHLCADCTKDDFVEYVNSMQSDNCHIRGSYKRIPEIDILFNNINFCGAFMVVGHEALGKDPHIFHRDIQSIIDMKNYKPVEDKPTHDFMSIDESNGIFPSENNLIIN